MTTIRHPQSAIRNSCNGSVFVISAPSGAGKHTILRHVMERDPNLEYCISATTRPPRPGEIDGKDSYFMDRTEIMHRVEADEFVEWAQVHGRLYGTLRSELTRRLTSGKDVLLELDVQGMRNFTAARNDAVSVFVMAPSLDALEERLRARGANTEEDLALRLRNARAEIAAKDSFDYVIVNDNLEKAVADLQAIIRARRLEIRFLP
jgi:guanylate kinase